MPTTRSMTRKRVNKGLSTGLYEPLNTSTRRRTQRKPRNTQKRKKQTPINKSNKSKSRGKSGSNSTRKLISPSMNRDVIRIIQSGNRDIDDNDILDWGFDDVPNTSRNMHYNIQESYFAPSKGLRIPTNNPKSKKNRRRRRFNILSRRWRK